MSIIGSNILAGASEQGAGAGADYQISRSVRLRSGASAHFSRTPAASGNRQTWTWSGWVKRAKLGVSQYIFSAGTVATDLTQGGLNFQADNTLRWASSSTTYRQTAAKFRDPSSWMHIVVAFDTTLVTGGDRIKFFINGTQISSFGTINDPLHNTDYAVNQSSVHNIGRSTAANGYTDGYITEVNFIDGQALAPSHFGEIGPSGVWSPKQYTGTYGANGFFLNFSDNSAATSGALGNDSSGNNNDWTPNNISLTSGVTYDSMLDVPTRWGGGGNGRGNYCVFSPLDVNLANQVGAFDNGNLLVTTSSAGSGDYTPTVGTLGASSGKWYWEITRIGGDADFVSFGIADALIGMPSYVGNGPRSWGYFTLGRLYNNDAWVAYGASFTIGDVIGVALDLVGGTLAFYKNGVSQGTAATGLVGTFRPAVSDLASIESAVISANFGAGSGFAYSPPAGFMALNTYNTQSGVVITSGSFIGNLSADGPAVYLNGTPTDMTINGNAVTLGTHADKTASGFKVRSSSASYNTAGSNTYSITTNSGVFKTANAQVNP